MNIEKLIKGILELISENLDSRGKLVAQLAVVGFDLVLDLLQKELGKGVEDMTNREMAQAILAIKRKSVDELIQEGIDRA